METYFSKVIKKNRAKTDVPDQCTLVYFLHGNTVKFRRQSKGPDYNSIQKSSYHDFLFLFLDWLTLRSACELI